MKLPVRLHGNTQSNRPHLHAQQKDKTKNNFTTTSDKILDRSIAADSVFSTYLSRIIIPTHIFVKFPYNFRPEIFQEILDKDFSK